MHLFDWLRRRRVRDTRSQTRRRRAHAKPRLEALENRVVPTLVKWTNVGGGTWNTPGNWSTGSLPGANDDVEIPALASSLTVTHSTNVIDQVKSVTLDANASGTTSLVLSSGTLSVTGNLQTSTGGNVTIKGGTLANATVTNGSKLALSDSGGTLFGVTIASAATLDATQNIGGSQAYAVVTAGLTLNGTANLGAANGNTYGTLYFEGGGIQTLSGTGTVTFGTHTSNRLAAEGDGGSNPVTLTIASGITMQGGSGGIGAFYSKDSFVNNGTLTTPSGQTLVLNGFNWVNNGTVTANGATVNLSGTFTVAALGNFSASGGVVNLQGTLNNAGTTLPLAPAIGAWRLLGGTVSGGTVTSTGGATLALTDSGGTLSGVTIASAATLDATQNIGGSQAYAVVTAGLTLNGTANLGAANGNTYGTLYFEGGGIQTLSGTGTVTFGTHTSNRLAAAGDGGSNPVTLTIASGITMQGGSGGIGAFYSKDSFVNNGTLTTPSGQTLVLNGFNWVNNGTVTANGATVNLNGTFTVAALGNFSASGGVVNQQGTLNNAGTTLPLAPAIGAWRLLGGTVIGGTVTSAGGATLALSDSGGTLAGVTIAAGTTIDATQNINGSQEYAVVTGGLTLNGTANLGAANGNTYGTLYFEGGGIQTLSGTGTVTFGTHTSNRLTAEGDGGSNPVTLTIASGITMQGGSGGIGAFYSKDSFVNNGALTIPSGQTLVLNGFNWVNNGTVTANEATVNLNGTFTVAALGNFSATGSIVNLVGTLYNRSEPLLRLVNANLQTYGNGGFYPPGGTALNVGGVPFTLTDFPGGGTGIIQLPVGTPTAPSSVDIPLNVAAPTAVYTLINSAYGQYGYLDGAVEFFGTNNAYARFNLVQGVNIRDHNNNIYNNTIAPGTPSASFGGGQVRLDRQEFDLPSSFIGTTLTDMRFSGYGGNPTGQPFLAAVSLLQNSDTVLTLGPTLGVWRLHGGTINGGIVTSTGGATLALTTNAGTLAGVTIAAGTTVDATQNITGSSNYANVIGGLTLYGTANLGATGGATSGELDFRGTQTLSGSGKVVFGGSASNVLYAIGNNDNIPATLTIGGRMTVSGGNGSIKGYYTTSSSDRVVNDGTILVASGQTVNLGGVNALNAGLIGIAGGAVKLVGTSFTNTVGGLIGGHGTFTTTGVTFTNNGIVDLLSRPSLYNVDVAQAASLSNPFVSITHDDAGAMNAVTVTNAANYTILGSGGDGIFGNGNDVDRSGLISQITYNNSTKVATLQLASALPIDFYRIGANGDAVLDAAGTPLLPGATELVNRIEDQTAATVSVTLDPASDSGISNHDGLTNDTTPTFDVQVNQAGAIGIDYEGNGQFTGTLYAPVAGTYQLTAPTLAPGTHAATATFTALSGALGQGSTGYTIDTTGARVTAMNPSAAVGTSVSFVTVTFNKPVNLSTFNPAAITLTGPNGAIAVSQPFLVSGDKYSIGFAKQSVQGTYTLTIAATVADLAGNAMDQNQNGINGEAGDSFIGSFNIALPDLTVETTTSPSTAVEGTSVAVTWKVKNISATNATGATWTDAVYLSTQSTLDNTATQLISLAGPSSAVAPGADYARSASVTLPGNLATGNFFLLFVADDNGGQLETDSSNDMTAVAINLTAPDLVVTSVSGPTSGFTGQTVLVSWTDQNNGTAVATGPWVDRFYAGTDAQGNNRTLLANFTFAGTLANGASVQRIQQVILPQIAGTLWFSVTTNADRSVGEGTNFANDTTVASNSINIQMVPLPDLVVTAITPPANGVFSGNSVPVSFTVKNQGPAPTSTPVWQDWVILSQDATLGQSYQGQLNPTGPGGDQLLNNQSVILGFNNPSYLAPGDSYLQNVTVPLPIDAQGLWYVYVVPDGTGAHHPFAMPEVSRTDKLAISAAFSVKMTPPPDLAVSGVQAPAQDFSGQPMKLKWTVTNGGTGATDTDAWTDAVYMSAGSTLDASATLLGKFPHQGTLQPGDRYTSNPTVTLPIGVSGSFYFIVQTDIKGQVFENGATANDTASTPAAVTVNLTPPPDLTVTSVTTPATAIAGHSFTFAYKVTDAGAGATPNYNWNDALFLSPTPTFDAHTAISLGQQTHQGSLAAGANYTNTATVSLPNGLTGPYYVFVDTDSASAVFELDKTNNLGGSATAMEVSAALPDLIAFGLTAPAEALPGTALLVQWTVANQSTGDTVVGFWEDNVYISTKGTLDNSAVLLGAFPHYGLLAGNSTYAPTQLVALPIDLLGNYNLFVVANASGDVHESNTANNTSSPASIAIKLTVTDSDGNTTTAAVADLHVAALTATLNADNTATLNWTVQNSGIGVTDSTYLNDDVWLSTHTTLASGGSDVYVGTVQHTNPLASGANYSAAATFPLPQSFVAGNYYFIVATDRPIAPPSDVDGEGVNLVYESDETNNERATSTAPPISPAPLSDLTVTSVTAPATATSGAQLAVTWTVANIAADTGNVPITDSVYLSYDQVVDTTDRYLGSVTHSGGLGGGTSYTQNASRTLPAGLAGTFYVFVKANSSNNLPEVDKTNNTGFAAQPVQIALSPPADLVAGTVMIPGNAVAGQDIAITYQVSNHGSNPAIGSWTDALYLSPTATWNVSDPLLGHVPQTQNVAPNGSYTGTLTAPLPGVTPGSYYVILRSNILDNFPEPTLSNNLSASITQTAIDAPALTLGVPTTGTLVAGQFVYYRVVVTAGQTLQLQLTGQDSSAYNELYASFGRMPSRSKYDFRYGQPFARSQEITIPTTRAGTYYLLVYGDTVPTAPESYTIEASLVPFSIKSVLPGQAGTGPVTLQISGAHYNFGTSFQLRQGSVTINATRTLLNDAATAFATFDLSGKAQGAYDVWGAQADGTSTELAAGLNVVAAMSNQVQLNLIVPDAVLVGRPGTVTVAYTNPGNTDLPAPLVFLQGGNALFQVPGQTDYSTSTLQLYGFNDNGPFGTLPPGFQGSITVSFKPINVGLGIPCNFTLQVLRDPTEPFDWNGVIANDLPLNTSPQQWAAMVAQASPLIGSTWGDVVSFIGTKSVQLEEAANANSIVGNNLYNFDALLQYDVGIYGTTPPSGTTPSFPVLASEGEVTVYDAKVDGSGHALPLNPAYPTFVIIPGVNGYQADFGALAQAILADPVCFPNSQVNVLIATWQGATSGPPQGGIQTPWTAALHVNAAGTNLGDILASFFQQGEILTNTTTVIGADSGVYVGNQAARIAGGLQNAVALNPASEFGGYLTPSLRDNFQFSTAYETNSLFDTQQPIAASNQTLNTGDLNNPVLQHTYGVQWLTGQVQAGNCYLLKPGYIAGPDDPPPANNPPPPSFPWTLDVVLAVVLQIESHDPNIIIGPKGCGTNQAVTNTQPMPYQVLYTNQSSANGPAQQVRITDKIDPNLDKRAFRLGSFGFRGMTFSVPANSAYYQTTIDLTAQFGFDLQFTATIDESTGIATWLLTTIDPTTGEPPINPTIGLLPPDNSSGVGEGFVTYTIIPDQTKPTGTVISAKATVTFDTQPPLDTAPYFNTIDTGTGLASSVAALPANEPTPSFNVSWAGTDALGGSGISGYTIFVSDNAGPHTAWLSNTPLTSAAFTGQGGHSYSFYSVATDFAGNVEPAPSQPDATTTVDKLPAFTNADQTTFVAGTPGTFTVTASGVPAPTLGENGSDTLPTGVNFDAASGILAGTATGAGGNYTLHFTAHNGIGSDATQTFTLTVDQAAAITSGNSATFVAGTSGSFIVTATGFPAPTLSENSGDTLPSGVTFNASIGLLSGTAALTSGGIYTLHFIAQNGVGSDAAQTFTLTVDAPPTSSVSSLPAFTPLSFPVSWSGSVGFGATSIVSYDIFVSDNNGAFTPFLLGTTQTSATFTGADSHLYAFYSVATDNLGHRQPTPAAGQASTRVDGTAPTSSVVALAAFSPLTFTVSWSGSDNNGGAGLASYDIYVSDNGAAFTPLLTGTKTTSTSFTGLDGHTYGFYSVAVDAVGNRQPTPSGAQATTQIDATAPTGTVASLPAFSLPSFTVAWSGSDTTGGSGIANFSVFASDNGAPFTPWLAGVMQTSATFTGVDRHIYGFYSVAVDKAGNRQATPSGAQTSTTVDGAAPTSSVASLPAFSPASFLVSWSGGDGSGAGIAFYDVFASTDNGSFTPFQTGTTQTSATFNGTIGHTYGFYSVATDKLGQRQPTPSGAQASTVTADVITVTGKTIAPTEGTAFTGSVATFTDTTAGAVPSNYNATITWGDGHTSSGTIASAGSGTFDVTGTNNYGQNGSFTTGIAIAAKDGRNASGQGSANVADGANIGNSVAITVAPGETVLNALVATFTDAGTPDPVADFAATVDWGDGSPTATATITLSGSTYSVTDSHIYHYPGKFTVQTTITEQGANPTIVSSPAKIGSADERYVDDLYVTLFTRHSEASGLAFWSGALDHGTPRTTLASVLTHSDEYFQTNVIKPAYLKYLGRAAESDGLAYWTQLMHSGLTDEQLEAGFIGSPEYYNKAGGTDKAWVDQMYTDLLGRPPDSAGENFWITQLQNHVARSTVALGFTASVERAKLRIQATYQRYLGRSADADGLNFWVSAFAHGATNEDIVTGFISSDEFFKQATK
jgi:hypothetical protein